MHKARTGPQGEGGGSAVPSLGSPVCRPQDWAPRDPYGASLGQCGTLPAQAQAASHDFPRWAWLRRWRECLALSPPGQMSKSTPGTPSRGRRVPGAEGGTPGRAKTKTQGAVGASPPRPSGFSLVGPESSHPQKSPENERLLPKTGPRAKGPGARENRAGCKFLPGPLFAGMAFSPHQKSGPGLPAVEESGRRTHEGDE